VTPVIGVFDSGVGGLSVLRKVFQELPGVPALYFADQGHVPYGARPLEEVRAYAEGITRFLLDNGSSIIVAACNTASAAGLHYLRGMYPDVHFVGMEPAVKPAAEKTSSGVVGVLATPATFQGALYASVVERFSDGVELVQQTCPGLVSQIEKGELDTQMTRSILEGAILPMRSTGVDTIVLGCTHYTFVIPLIEQIAGPEVRVIDPAPAVARQVKRVSDKIFTQGINAYAQPTHAEGANIHKFITSGIPQTFKSQISLLLDISTEVARVEWNNGRLS
jgi:glutamate racemase